MRGTFLISASLRSNSALSRMFGRGIAVLLMMISTSAFGHGGGLNADGCHNNRKIGGYHCHRGNGSGVPTAGVYRPNSASNASESFRNCTAARATGAAPVYEGTPGYGRHLDRDGDGVGCE